MSREKCWTSVHEIERRRHEDAPVEEIIEEPVAEAVVEEPVVEDMAEAAVEEAPVEEIVEEPVAEEQDDDENDELFSLCTHERGMSIEEYLRANKKYRSFEFVSHFFEESDINRALSEGRIMKKKGQLNIPSLKGGMKKLSNLS